MTASASQRRNVSPTFGLATFRIDSASSRLASLDWAGRVGGRIGGARGGGGRRAWRIVCGDVVRRRHRPGGFSVPLPPQQQLSSVEQPCGAGAAGRAAVRVPAAVRRRGRV